MRSGKRTIVARVLLTQKDDVYIFFRELGRESLSRFRCSVVGVIDNDLTTAVEKVKDQLFTAFLNLGSQFLCFIAFFTFQHV